MRFKKQYSFIYTILLLLASTPLWAEKVYKYMDEDGNPVFTDEPTKNAEELDIKPVHTIPAIAVPKPAPTSTDTKGPFQYDSIKITSPKNEENFINNGGNVTVQLSISPALRPTDKIQLMLNGTTKGNASTTKSFPLLNLPRGEYLTTVVILDEKNKEVGHSNSVTFFVRQNTAPKKTPKPTPKS